MQLLHASWQTNDVPGLQLPIWNFCMWISHSKSWGGGGGGGGGVRLG